MRAAANNSALLWRVCQSRVLQTRLLTYMRGKATSDRRTVLAGPPPGPAPLGPPLTLRTEELLGEVRLKADEPRDAIRALEQALRLTPKRSQALLGVARARSAAGDEAGAAAAYRQLLGNWGKADAGGPVLREVSAALTRMCRGRPFKSSLRQNDSVRDRHRFLKVADDAEIRRR